MTITAVDSNILIDVLAATPGFGPASRAALRRCLDRGIVVACEVVWAEVLAAFPDTPDTPALLERMPVAFDRLDEPSARRAGDAWGAYRRRGGPRIGIVADFLIGAHALLQADQLLTRDRGFYRRAFEGLRVVDPAD